MKLYQVSVFGSDEILTVEACNFKQAASFLMAEIENGALIMVTGKGQVGFKAHYFSKASF